MYYKIQPEQIEIHNFSSPSGDINFLIGSNYINANLSRSLTGNFDFIGDLLNNGVKIKSFYDLSNFLSGDNSFIFGGSDNQVSGIRNSSLNAKQAQIDGEGNAIINSNFSSIYENCLENTILGGNFGSVLANTTGSMILKDSSLFQVQNNINNSLSILFDGGNFIKRGGLTIEHGDLKVNEFGSGLFSGNLNILGDSYFSNRPTVNGSGVLLQGEQVESENLVYITGNQTVSGIKNFDVRPTVNGTGVLLEGEGGQIIDTTNLVTINVDEIITSKKTFVSGLVLEKPSNHLTFRTGSAGNRIDINVPNITANRVYTIPDIGSNAAFVMNSGEQNIGGLKKFSTRPTVGGTGVLLIGEIEAGSEGIGYANLTSSSNIQIGVGSKEFDTSISKSQSAFVVGQRVRVINTATNYMEGVITSFVGTKLFVDIDTTSGTGSYSNWTFAIAGVKGERGDGLTIKGAVPQVTDLPTSGNELNDFYIVEESGDGYVWDGSAWFDVGQIRGPEGPQGPQGIQGEPGIQGLQANGYSQLTSNTSRTLAIGSVEFTTNKSVDSTAFTSGSRIRCFSISNPSTKYMEGIITAFNSNLMTVLVDFFVGTGNVSDWGFSIAGQIGSTGPQGIQGIAGPAGPNTLTAGTTSNLVNGYVYILNGSVTSITAAPSGTISPLSRTVAAGQNNYLITVTPQGGIGTWTVTSKPDWVTLDKVNGTGTGSITVTVSANTGIERIGTIIVLEQAHTITQYGALVFSDTSAWNPSSAAQSLSPIRTVTASAGSTWSALSNQAWLTVSPTSTTTGTGSPQQFTASVSENTTSATRTGTITIGSQVINVSQTGKPVVITLSSSTSTVTTSAGSVNITLTGTPSGGWQATDIPSWVTVSPASGTASSTAQTVTITYQANTTTSERTANIKFNNANFELKQYKTISLSRSNSSAIEVLRAGTTVTIVVYASTGQSWSATRGAFTWLSLSLNGAAATTSFNSSGQQTVYVYVAANTTNARRSGNFSIAGFTFTVNQAA